MAGVHLTEEEQSERLKQWWRENGVSVVVGVVLGIAVIVGVNYWRTYKAAQAETASSLYAQMVDAGGSSAGDIWRRLIEDYSNTPYAGKAALVMARTGFENGDRDAAISHLGWAIDNASDPADRTLARLRLARVLLDSGELERMQQLMSELEVGGYESEYRELLGDLAMAQGDPETARTAYESALEHLPEQSGFADMLNLKLDAAIGASQ